MKHFFSYVTLTLISISVVALVAVPVKGDNDPQTPYIQCVNPDETTAGGIIKVDGSFLGKGLVSDLYLTRGNTDIKLEITSQKTNQIVAKLPASVEPGRYRLMILTPGVTPRFIEQPVQLIVQ